MCTPDDLRLEFTEMGVCSQCLILRTRPLQRQQHFAPSCSNQQQSQTICLQLDAQWNDVPLCCFNTIIAEMSKLQEADFALLLEAD
jgi:hypothetical protein